MLKEPLLLTISYKWLQIWACRKLFYIPRIMLRLSLNTFWLRSACLQLLSPNLGGSLRFLMHWGNTAIYQEKCHVQGSVEYSLGFEFQKSVKFEFLKSVAAINAVYFLVLNIFSTIQLGSIIFTRYFSRHSSSLLSFRVFSRPLVGVLLLGKNWVFCQWQSIFWFAQRHPSPLPWQQLRAILNF